MLFDQLVESIIVENKDYYGKKIQFTDPETGKFYKEGTIVDPDVVQDIETDDCHGPHITDDWYGGCVHTSGKGFDMDNPPWYIVATGTWETAPTPEDFHFVSAKDVNKEMLKQSLSSDTKDSFEDLINSIM